MHVSITEACTKLFFIYMTIKRSETKLTDLNSPGQSAHFPGLLEEDVDREGEDVAHEGNGF